MAQPPSGLSSSLSRHSAGIEQGQQADLDPALMQDMEAVFGGEEATVIAAFEVGRSCKGDMKVVFSDEEATTVIAAFEVGGRDAAFDSSTPHVWGNSLFFVLGGPGVNDARSAASFTTPHPSCSVLKMMASSSSDPE